MGKDNNNPFEKCKIVLLIHVNTFLNSLLLYPDIKIM